MSLMKLAFVVVAFIAGYSVVSYVARKLKAGQLRNKPNDEGLRGPATDTSREKSEGSKYERNAGHDGEHPEQ